MSKLMAQYSSREKMIVAVAILIAMGLAIHAFVIEPYQLRVGQLHSQIEQQSSDLKWMQSVVQRLPSGGYSKVSTKIEGTLANFIDQNVRQEGLSNRLSQMTPIGSDEVRMRFSAVDFNRMIQFVSLINAGGVQVKDIRITASENPGIVDSSIVIERQ